MPDHAPPDHAPLDHAHFMAQAIALSREAYVRGDWPVGALVVKDGAIVGSGQNRQVTRADPTWHAETEAIRDAVAKTGSADLAGAVLYTAMEPCPMCAWAVRVTGIRTLVVGLRHAALKRTDLGDYSLETFGNLVRWDFELVAGVMEEEYRALRLEWMAKRAGG